MEWLVWILTDPGVHRICDYRFVIISRIHGLSLFLAGRLDCSGELRAHLIPTPVRTVESMD